MTDFRFFHSLMFSVEQGVIWFLLAAVAEVPPAVSLLLYILSAYLFRSSSFFVSGVPVFEPER
jgi:hypothetical protein